MVARISNLRSCISIISATQKARACETRLAAIRSRTFGICLHEEEHVGQLVKPLLLAGPNRDKKAIVVSKPAP